MAQNAQVAQHRLGDRNVNSSSMVPSSAFLRPQDDGDRRDQQQEDPGDESEERVEVSEAAVEELAQVEGQRALQDQEYDDEDGGNGAGKVGPQFASGDADTLDRAIFQYPKRQQRRDGGSGALRCTVYSGLRRGPRRHARAGPSGGLRRGQSAEHIVQMRGIRRAIRHDHAARDTAVHTALTSSRMWVDDGLSRRHAFEDHAPHVLVWVQAVGRLVQHQHRGSWSTS